MNILFISHEASRSGAPIVLLNLIKEIKSKKTDITCTVLLIYGGPLTEEFKKLCKVITLNNEHDKISKLLLSSDLGRRIRYRLLLQQLKRQQYDLIYANTIVSIHTAVSIKERLNIPILLHVHETVQSFPTYGVTERFISKCDYFIASAGMCHDALVQYKVQPERIFNVYPFSEIGREIMSSHLSDEKETNKQNSIVKIGWIGPLIERKGASILPYVLQRLKTVRPNCNFVIQCIGSFIPCNKWAIYDIKQTGLDDKFVDLGSHDNPIPLFKEVDFTLMLSRFDSFGLGVMECGLLGKPTILFDGCCGVQKFIENEVSGIVVPYFDIDGIVQAILKLYDSPEKRMEMGKRFQQNLLDYYQKNDTNDIIIKHLQELKEKMRS